MNPGKLRALLYEKDKNPQAGAKPTSAINNTGLSNPTLGNKLPGGSISMPVNKSAPGAMSPGLPNPMGMAHTLNAAPKAPSMPKMSLPNPTAAPSVIGQQPSLPKPARFGRMKKALKPTKEF
jgi:hypothetical protein